MSYLRSNNKKCQFFSVLIYNNFKHDFDALQCKRNVYCKLFIVTFPCPCDKPKLV